MTKRIKNLNAWIEFSRKLGVKAKESREQILKKSSQFRRSVDKDAKVHDEQVEDEFRMKLEPYLKNSLRTD